MPQYLLLAGAILTEVIGTLALKASAGLTRLTPSMVVLLGYGAAFLLLSQVLKLGMPVGTAYAIWASVGVATVAVAGHVLFAEALGLQAMIGIGLIIAGVTLVEMAR
jgi:small multidrug resistance pump